MDAKLSDLNELLWLLLNVCIIVGYMACFCLVICFPAINEIILTSTVQIKVLFIFAEKTSLIYCLHLPQHPQIFMSNNPWELTSCTSTQLSCTAFLSPYPWDSYNPKLSPIHHILLGGNFISGTFKADLFNPGPAGL